MALWCGCAVAEGSRGGCGKPACGPAHGEKETSSERRRNDGSFMNAAQPRADPQLAPSVDKPRRSDVGLRDRDGDVTQESALSSWIKLLMVCSWPTLRWPAVSFLPRSSSASGSVTATALCISRLLFITTKDPSLSAGMQEPSGASIGVLLISTGLSSALTAPSARGWPAKMGVASACVEQSSRSLLSSSPEGHCRGDDRRQETIGLASGGEGCGVGRWWCGSKAAVPRSFCM